MFKLLSVRKHIGSKTETLYCRISGTLILNAQVYSCATEIAVTVVTTFGVVAVLVMVLCMVYMSR